MKLILKYCSLFIAGAILYYSCKKDYSCENCRGANKPPIANAGRDTGIILPTDSVLLDGSASTDPDDGIATYQWKKISGPDTFQIANPSSSKTTVRQLVKAVYTFELTVTDKAGLSDKDTMQLTVNPVGTINRPPIANAGNDSTMILPANVTILDGSRSSDPDNNIIGYTWIKIVGPPAFSITNENAVQSQVTNLVEGIYQFELTVTDAGGLFSMDTIQVVVNKAADNTACNTAMTAIGHLPTPGAVRFAVTAGNKILFTRAESGRVDIYDTVTRSWESVTGMHAASNYIPSQTGYKTAIIGKKIIFSVMANPLDTTQGQLINIYDAGTNSWTIQHLAQARSFYAMAVVGNKAYYAGGNTDSKKIDVFDATSNSWSTINFINSRRNWMTAVSVGNKIFFAGGLYARYDSLVMECDDFGNNCRSVPAIVGSDRVDILDVSTNTWSEARLSEGRAGISKAVVGNKIVFAGGEKASGGYSHKIDIYDISSNAWSSTDLPQYYGNEEVYGAYSIGNKVLLPGSDNVHVYDVPTNSWSKVQMPWPHQADMHERGMVTSVGNKLFFFLQYNQPDHSRGINIYDASTNTWCHTQLDFDLIRTGMVAVGNSVYIGGGGGMTGCCSYNTLFDTLWQVRF